MSPPPTPELIDRVAEALRADPLQDRGGLLKGGGRRQIREALARHQRAGRKAYVLVIDKGQSPAPWAPLWEALGADDAAHLLLIFNGEAWRARGWGLDNAHLNAALDAAASRKGHYAFKIVTALDGLAGGSRADADASAQLEPASTGLVVGLSAGGVALLGGLAFVLRRRRALQTRGKVEAAVEEAERALAALILDVEGLPEGTEVRLEFMGQTEPLQRDLDAAKREARARGEDPVAMGRLRTVTNHIAALHSSIRQRKLNTPGGSP